MVLSLGTQRLPCRRTAFAKARLFWAPAARKKITVRAMKSPVTVSQGSWLRLFVKMRAESSA